MSTETTVGIREFGSSEDGEDEKAEKEMGLCFWGIGKKMRLSIGIAIEEHRDGRSRAAFGPDQFTILAQTQWPWPSCYTRELIRQFVFFFFVF